MILDVKVTFHTAVAAGDENQLYVWLVRMGELIANEGLSQQVAISIFVDGDVNIAELPKLPCVIRMCKGSDNRTYGSELLRMAALNEALSPACATSVFMGLNVLPVRTLKPFMMIAKTDAIDHAALCHGRNRTNELKEEMIDEHFRRLVISTNYYSSDLMVFDVDKTSRKLAAMRTFDLVERRQQIKNQGDSIIDDILNKLLPTTNSFRNNDVYFVNPLTIIEDSDPVLSSMREKAYQAQGAVVFDRDNLPWELNDGTTIAKVTPYGEYATAALRAHKWLHPDFLRSVLVKANYYSKLDGERRFRLPELLVDALNSDTPASEIHDIVCQLKQEGSLQ
ncbi:hypothetical protein [Photobacterium kasasachensis]|uniref:hypothetical protein n=1 Tax=Photobacterium kasasachensis TaxID=2910240 RepID=UPI003D118464